mmetsp:Transcript_15949/g.29473  ORF Transcript_15949/g.29473 Transcript_15949/m.29473 type:complete len:273 (+) Transcript_15949:504-1322(+)
MAPCGSWHGIGLPRPRSSYQTRDSGLRSLESRMESSIQTVILVPLRSMMWNSLPWPSSPPCATLTVAGSRGTKMFSALQCCAPCSGLLAGKSRHFHSFSALTTWKLSEAKRSRKLFFFWPFSFSSSSWPNLSTSSCRTVFWFDQRCRKCISSFSGCHPVHSATIDRTSRQADGPNSAGLLPCGGGLSAVMSLPHSALLRLLKFDIQLPFSRRSRMWPTGVSFRSTSSVWSQRPSGCKMPVTLLPAECGPRNRSCPFPSSLMTYSKGLFGLVP